MHSLLRVKFGQHINQRLCVQLTLARFVLKDNKKKILGIIKWVLFILAEYISNIFVSKGGTFKIACL